MSYQVFARKYRPQTFGEVVGQTHITQTLKNAIEAGRLHHAYLFTGVRGVGKTTVARIFTKALNCEKAPIDEPCNQCQSCLEITAGSSLDIQEIDGASNTGVDDVREIRERLRYLPSKSKYKVYIIDEVHMLSTAAFNALLKTLEEPPPHVIFIFATTEPQKIPATILSRCQRHDFRRIAVPVIVDTISKIASSEDIKVEPDAMIAIASEADGSMRDAQSLFDQSVAFSGKDVTYNKLKDMLGFMDRSQLKNLLQSIVSKDSKGGLQIVDDIFNQGSNLVRLSQDMLYWFRNLLVLKATGDQAFLKDIPSDDRDFIAQLVESRDLSEWEQMFHLCYRQVEEISRSKYAKMLLEVMVVKLSEVRPVRSVESLIKKVDSLIGNSDNVQSVVTAQTQVAPKPSVTVKKNSSEPVNIPNPVQKGAIEETAWKGFLKWLRNEKPQLFSIVEHGVFVGGTTDSISLQYNSGSVYGDMLGEAHRKELLEKYLEKHFGKKFRINFKIIKDEIPQHELKRSKIQEDKKMNRQLIKEAMEHDVVKDTISIMGADIKDIKVNKRS